MDADRGGGFQPPKDLRGLEAPAAKPPSLAQILARRALDLAAISLVAIVGLTAGREIVSWWRAAPPAAEEMLTDPQMEWSERPLDVHFGDASSFARLPFRGTAAAVNDQLIDELQRRLPQTAALPLASPEELAWIETLRELTPARTADERAKLYLVPAILPTAAAVVSADDATPRLAGWAIALPAGDEAWTLLVFTPTKSESSAVLAEISLPGGATRLFGWTDERGQGVLAFSGRGLIDAWQDHFDARFGPRLASSDPQHGRWRHNNRRIDVQFSAVGPEITALLWLTTPTSDQNTVR